MSTTLSRNAEVLLAELYAAEDLQELYATVARQLAERHSVEGFAIRLLTRRHESFLEYEHGRVPDEGGTRILPLEIRGRTSERSIWLLRRTPRAKSCGDTASISRWRSTITSCSTTRDA